MSGDLRAHVDTDVCIGSGVCEASAPDLFEVTDEGTSHVLVDGVPADRVEAARQAAADCPTRAIKIEDS